MPTSMIATADLGSPLDVWAAIPRPVSTTKRTVWVRLAIHRLTSGLPCLAVAYQSMSRTSSPMTYSRRSS